MGTRILGNCDTCGRHADIGPSGYRNMFTCQPCEDSFMDNDLSHAKVHALSSRIALLMRCKRASERLADAALNRFLLHGGKPDAWSEYERRMKQSLSFSTHVHRCIYSTLTRYAR